MDKKYLIYINGDSLVGETYKKIVEYLFTGSDVFTYTKMDTEKCIDEDDIKYAENVRKFENIIKGLSVKKIRTCNYGFTCGGENEIYAVSLKNEALKSFIKNKKDISKWSYPNCVENIGFYKNNKCVFASVSHEDMYHLYVDSAEDVAYLEKIGVDFFDKAEVNENSLFNLE
ncbi:MAG: hypothetical protein IJ447_02510 [Clostridia bacterium]|nr:hypothetical protein [Clostridia bacterium]